MSQQETAGAAVRAVWLERDGPGRLLGRMHSLKTTLGRLRVIGWWEGASFLLLLFVAMPLKYFADQPLAVRYVGMAHGVLFVLFIWAAVQAALVQGWNWKRTGLVMLGAFLPFGPFVVDSRLLRGETPRD